MTSPFISSQKSFMKPKLTPSGPGLLKLSQSQIAAFTSASEKGFVSSDPSAPDNLLNLRLSTPGRNTSLTLK
ncbi:hypothetical protein QL285_025591 [Trifolium repens]|nr:hypothetical protein QL285_025591 [Trifolium repens]